MTKKSNKEEFTYKANLIFNNKYDYSKVEYINSSSKVLIVCPIHGEFLQSPNAHLRGTHGCGKCGEEMKHINKKYSLEKILIKAKEVHGNKYDYSEATYEGILTYTKIKCKKHGEFTQKWNDHVNGRYGCSKCGMNKRVIDGTDEYKQRFLDKLPDTIIMLDEYSNSIKFSRFNCTIHGEFITKPYYINENLNLCKKCSKLSGTSQQEESLVSFIKSFGVAYTQSYRGFDTISELDIYIPSKKLAIEYDGLYWHSDKFKDPNFHYNKTIEAEQQQIQLIHIFEDEWVLKNDIVKSRLRNILGSTPFKVYARNTYIKEVPWPDVKLFLEANHIQGKGAFSTINLGLYKDAELMALMTFGGKRISLGNSGKEGHYELLRFCNKLDTNVVGGASKLLKHFVTRYKPKEIISYADRRWSQGNLYKQLGFSEISTSRPNYFYIKNQRRENRFKYAKHNLVKQGYSEAKTEAQIMKDLGILRIYDCGTKKFTLKLAGVNKK